MKILRVVYLMFWLSTLYATYALIKFFFFFNIFFIKIFFLLRRSDIHFQLWTNHHNGACGSIFCCICSGFESATVDFTWLISSTGSYRYHGGECNEAIEYRKPLLLAFHFHSSIFYTSQSLWHGAYQLNKKIFLRLDRLTITRSLSCKVVFFVFNPALVSSNLAKTVTFESVVLL